jgi:hypothetical protein
MKIFNISKEEKHIYYNNIKYIREYSDNIIFWAIEKEGFLTTYLGEIEEIEDKYQRCLRKYKLKNILDENY